MLPPIVDTAWLSGRLEHSTTDSSPPGLIVVHVGTSMHAVNPYEAYLGARLPGALYVSLDDDLAGPPGAVVGRHPLPQRAAFELLLEQRGITEHSDVVAYDTLNGSFASRFVWMLRILDRSAALLDRGNAPLPDADPSDAPPRAARQTDDRPGDVIEPPPSAVPVDWPHAAIAHADEVAAHIADGGLVVDSRASERYRGDVEPLDAQAGHIPGAINLPFAGNYATDGRVASIRELSERFAVLAEDPSPIVSCGSGVTACHNALAIEAAGAPLPRVYVGSWSGWSTDPTRPVATGPDRFGPSPSPSPPSPSPPPPSPAPPTDGDAAATTGTE